MRFLVPALAPLLAAGLIVGCARAPLAGTPAPRPASGLAAANAHARTIASGERLAAAFFAGDAATLWAACDVEMRAALGTPDAVRKMRDDLLAEVGAPSVAGASYVTEAGDMRYFSRAYAFAKAGERAEVVIVFLPDGMVGGFQLRPLKAEAATPHLGYRTKAAMRLPFEGAWTVVWGGRTVDANYHAAYQDQRFAYDLAIMKGGRTHTGDGRRNEDYYCFGAPLVAPAAGKVAAVVADLPDNAPGQTDAQHPCGNHVVLDLGEGEFAFMAHMQQGSVKVRAGDAVAPGQALGRCGNSGNTSEPHLHFHVQDRPTFQATGDEAGLPAQFQAYTADGKPVSRGEPTRGQVIAPAAAAVAR